MSSIYFVNSFLHFKLFYFPYNFFFVTFIVLHVTVTLTLTLTFTSLCASLIQTLVFVLLFSTFLVPFPYSSFIHVFLFIELIDAWNTLHRFDICAAVREVRCQNSNTLSGLNTDKIVERVRQQLRSRRPSAGTAKVAPWAGLTQGQGVKTGPEWQGPSKEEVVKEETCSICLEPLNTSPNQSLACLHTFHALCINDWIKIQSNCPNCRKFALMPDEYPTLS